MNPEMQENKMEKPIDPTEVSQEQEKKLKSVEKTDGTDLAENTKGLLSDEAKKPESVSSVENKDSQLQSELLLSSEELNYQNKMQLFDFIKDYLHNPNFGQEKTKDGVSNQRSQVKNLLLKIYPNDIKESNLSNNRQIESVMKNKVGEVTKYLIYNDTYKKEGLTQQELDTIKQKVAEKGPSSEYLFDGNMRITQSGEKITKVDGSNVVGEWNFVAKDTSYEDPNTVSLVKDNVQKLQTQLEQIKNNPNIDPESIRVVVHSSASNLRYIGEGGNQSLSDQRAQNVQKLISSNFLGVSPKIDMVSEVSGPVYPPTVDDLQNAGFDAGSYSLEDVVSHYQDPTFNKMLEEQLYRPYQKVNVSLDYKEIKKEPLYTVESKRSEYAEIQRQPINNVIDLYIDNSLIDQLDPKEKKEIVDSIKDPNIKADFERNFLTTGSLNAGFKFRLNTSFASGSDLFDTATQTPMNMRNNDKAAEQSQDTSYEYKGRDLDNQSNVESSKVSTKKITDISVLKQLVQRIGDGQSTDKEIMNIIG